MEPKNNNYNSNYNKIIRRFEKFGEKLDHLVHRRPNDPSPTTTPPATPRNKNKLEVSTPIKHRKVKKSPLIIEVQNPFGSMEETIKEILNALDEGRSESEIIPLLHALCEMSGGSIFDRVAILNMATSWITNRLEEDSLKLLTQFEKSDKIPRSTAADELYISLTYNKLHEAVKCNHAYKNRGKNEGLGREYANVPQETAVKTLLVLTELMADYARLDTKNRHGSSTTREQYSVMSKPDMVDQIFADAEEVFRRDSSQVLQQVAQYQLAWPAIPAKAHIPVLKTMKALEKEAHMTKTLSPFVTGKYQPNFKRAILVIQTGPTPEYSTGFKEVIIEWSNDGKVKTLRHALPDVSEISAEELEKLRLANVLGISRDYAPSIEPVSASLVGQAAAYADYAPAIPVAESESTVNQATMHQMNPEIKDRLERYTGDEPIKLTDSVSVTFDMLGTASFSVQLLPTLVRVVDIVWEDRKSTEMFSFRQRLDPADPSKGYRRVTLGVIEKLREAKVLLDVD